MRGALVASLVLLGACAGTPTGATLESSAAPADLADLVLVDMNGRQHPVQAEWSAGRSVVLVFWQTWCLSCEREAASVVAAAKARPDLAFFGVVPGTDDDVNDFEVLAKVEQQGMTYPQIRDRDLSLTETFDVQGTPTLLVIGPDGKVSFRGHEVPEDWLAR
ncbi:TlpA family protein disulfide reductase [Engelhardtia mirabilis]